MGVKSGGYFVLNGQLSAGPELGAFGHHHKNCQKNLRTSESNGKSRRTRLSKNSVNSSSDSGAVRDIWWVLNLVGISGLAAGNQLGLYWELSATTTRRFSGSSCGGGRKLTVQA